MSELKMSSVFNGKVDPSDFSVSSSIVCYQADDGVAAHEAAAEAVNSYDKNQELIAKQAEQIEILRDALTEIAKLPEVRMDEGQYLACRALEQASKD